MFETCARVFQIASSLTLFLFISASCSVAQTPDGISPAAQTYLEQALDLIQKNALNKNSINWTQVRQETLARAKGSKTTFDTYPAIAFALTRLQEHHSFLRLPDNLPVAPPQAFTFEGIKYMGSYRPNPNPSPFFPRKEMQGHIDRGSEKNFAHVVVPMCVPQYSEWEKNGPDFQLFAQKLHGIVTDLQAQKPDGWIIDLRGNSGGNMWPMLAGIGVVLGEGDLGSFISADGERVPWFYKSGKAGTRVPQDEDNIEAEVKQPPFAFPDLPWVAVLLDRGTSSSGEAVAIALAGRPRKRSFGEHTAGFSTSNGMHELPDGAVLFLCEGVEADRTGKLYPDGLDPDVRIPAPETRPAEEKDAALQSAEKWLVEQTTHNKTNPSQ